MNTGRNNKQITCLCRDTGGKGTLPAQHTTFNTLDNWAIKKPHPIKKEKDRKEKVIGSWPGGWGIEGKQVGSMDEEPQVRGCYNITFICTPTNQETV